MVYIHFMFETAKIELTMKIIDRGLPVGRYMLKT